MGHLELGEVGLEGHLGVVGLAGVDAGLARHAHVVLPCLEEWRRSNHGNKSAALLIEYSLSINIGVQAYNPFHTHWHQRGLNKQQGNEQARRGMNMYRMFTHLHLYMYMQLQSNDSYDDDFSVRVAVLIIQGFC